MTHHIHHISSYRHWWTWERVTFVVTAIPSLLVIALRWVNPLH